MKKIIALMKVDHPEFWNTWHSGSTASLIKSPVYSNKRDAENWLNEELKKYPDARINEKAADKKYFITTTIISFDNKGGMNFEAFLSRLGF